ncbi:MAG: ACP S-malonyltransferase [Pseudonocardiaceae bacterium]|nr:ACP S-malonyltransferase [Pseudonocardiaceae bacterium]
MVAYLFPGQGSQHAGMGEGLFDEFAELTRTADKILGYSIADLCLADPDKRLRNTQYTQPALYVVNAFNYYKRVAEQGRPDAVAGHSLGEYNALLAAGVFDFADGLQLVRKRGELMAKARGGGMAAVLNKTEKEVRDILADDGFDDLDVANLNAPTQIVLSGLRSDIERAKDVFEADGSCQYVMLPVSGAFHSRYMTEAQGAFAEYLSKFDLRNPDIPVVANVTARLYHAGEVWDTLVAQLTSPVKWSESIRYLLGKGHDDLVEVGPGRVLTSLTRNIRQDSEPLIVDEPLTSDEQTRTTEVPASQIQSQQSPIGRADANAAGDRRDAAAEPVTNSATNRDLTAAPDLGSGSFKRDHGIRYACVTGGMHHGVASSDLVAAVSESGMLGFLGTSGRTLGQVDADVASLKRRLDQGRPFGVNITHNPGMPGGDDDIVDLLLRHEVRVVEAAAYLSITPALVRYRLAGLRREPSGRVLARNRIIAKISRPEVAEKFLSPPPAELVERLRAEGHITGTEAELSGELPMAEDLCCEADSGGHTDQRPSLSVLPGMLRLRDDAMAKHGYAGRVRVGIGGGIGTPDAAAACFVMGADFIMTGSINQCTVQAGTSDLVKDLLQTIDIQDTGYAPAGELFEYGARVQVLKKGVLFQARANKLYELYKRHGSLDELQPADAEQLQKRYFKMTFDDVFAEVSAGLSVSDVEKAERDPKQKMALVFRWYLDRATQQAIAGAEENKVDFQVYCGPSLGAFNRWVEKTKMADWRSRHVGEINRGILEGAATLLDRKLAEIGTD